MDPAVALALVGFFLLVGFYLGYHWRGQGGGEREEPPRPKDTGRLYALAEQTIGPYQASASPADLLVCEPFVEGIGHLGAAAYSDDDLLGYFTGDNAVVACMALEALARRPGGDEVVERILAGFNEVVPWTRYFAFRVLEARVAPGAPLVGRVLARVDATWNYGASARLLREFLERRVAGGEKPEFGEHIEALAGRTAPDDDAVFPGAGPTHASHALWLEDFMSNLGDGVKPMLEELRRWNAGQVNEDALRALGAVWDSVDTVPEPVSHPALERRVSQLESDLLQQPSRSVLLIGETGTGKTAAIHALGRRMKQRGFTLFEAGHAELLAGMTFMGQLEERLRQLVELVGGGRPVLWIVPQFHALSWAGKHQYEQSSVLDYLLPRIERGEIRVVGETTPGGYQRLIRSKPRCRTALHALSLEPLAADETLQLARDWVEQQSPAEGPPIADEATLGEAWGLAQQFMGTRAAPGNLLELLSVTLRGLRGGENEGSDTEVRIGMDDLLSTLISVTGLPASILDDRATLDLDRLRTLFESRVMGQPEVVDCLVERVAMIKAGVTDPTRPQGVFLLAGPTGTGKTEIAKTLAEFLFGSPDRMIRLDMSEFQDEGSLGRILGDTQDNAPGDSLIDQLRKQPFSLVLLDEFEKANYRIWDLFLQVFDDGRLTDRLGRTGDFRHALILMTSNLGASIPSGLGLGFLDRSGAFSSAAVLREVDNAFRKEFLNRIDRVIVFRPLERETMRSILRKELNEVFRRRGLRNRQWAVEWDGAALDFLLEKGFTADMGARPLKRAIERHLLAPLAQTIVDHRFPAGDQFLFVSSTGSELQVRFVSADAAEAPPSEETAAEEPAPTGIRLQDVVFSPRGAAAELGLLRSALNDLVSRTNDEGLRRAKKEALEAVSAPGFWESAGRFAVLGRAEYLDRIESGLEAAGSLLERLEQMGARRGAQPPRDLVGQLAQRLWLIGHAVDDVAENRPTEAWLLVDAGYETGSTAMRSNPFAERLDRMYRGWARRRGMKLEVLEEISQPGLPYRAVLSVSGFAAWALLRGEDGVHVWEVPREGTKRAPARRCAVRVRVVAQPDAPVAPPLSHAQLALNRPEGAAPEIVRRYRETPSPLVRDLRGGWRTGLLDRVLAGDFDLI